MGQGLATYPLNFGTSAGAFRITGTLRIGGVERVNLTGIIPDTLRNLVLENGHATGISMATLTGSDMRVAGDVLIGEKTTLYGGDKKYTIGGSLTNYGALNGKDADITFTSTKADDGNEPEPATISGTGTASFRNFTVAEHARVILAQEITHVYGNLEHKGAMLDGSGAEVKFMGSAPSAVIASAGNAVNVQHVHVAKTDGATVTLQAPLEGVTSLMVESGTLDAQGYTIQTRAEEAATEEATTEGGTTEGTAPEGETVEDASNTPYFSIYDGAVFRLSGSVFPEFRTYDFAPTSTVVYEGDAQSIRSTQYGNLQLLNTGTKSFEGETAKIAGTLTLAEAVDVVAPDVVAYNGPGAQAVAAINYNNLVLSNAGEKRLAAGTIGIAKSIVLADNASINAASSNTTVDYNGGLAQDVLPTNYHNLRLSSGSAKRFSGTTGIAADFSIAEGATADLAAENTITFNGARNQDVPALQYKNLQVSAAGAKTLLGDITVEKELALTAGIMRTGSHKVTLGTAEGSISETESAYVMGTVETVREVAGGMAQPFGGLGISIEPAVPAGFTKVTRVTGVPLGITNNSIARSFTVEPGMNNGSLNAVVSLSYLEHELNGNAENELVFYRSDGGLDNWQMMPVENTTRNADRNLVMVTGLNKFSTVTLGGQYSPLPVELIYFRAVKSGKDAVLSWATASEQGSDGFAIEVSTDGATFRQLGFVKSKNGNSPITQKYSFTDTENGKAGVRYYRLRQVDTNGDEELHKVAAVNFGPVAYASATAHPNPFSSSLSLSITTPAAGAARIVVYDAIGQRLYARELQVQAGTSVIPLEVRQMSQHGVYILSVEVNGAMVGRLKVVKE